MPPPPPQIRSQSYQLSQLSCVYVTISWWWVSRDCRPNIMNMHYTLLFRPGAVMLSLIKSLLLGCYHRFSLANTLHTPLHYYVSVVQNRFIIRSFSTLIFYSRAYIILLNLHEQGRGKFIHQTLRYIMYTYLYLLCISMRNI